MSSRAATIADLRAHLSAVAPMRTGAPPVATGISTLDDHIQGWPCPGLVSIHGAAGTGRIGLVLPSLQAHTQAHRMVAIVDPLGWLYPPGLPDLHLQHLMLIRCGGTRAAWATAQLAASGAMPFIVLLDPPPLGRDARRMLRATETGQSTIVVLTERPDPNLCAPVRLRTLGQKQVQIERGASTQPVITL
jgi:hypothetical protein